MPYVWICSMLFKIGKEWAREQGKIERLGQINDQIITQKFSTSSVCLSFDGEIRLASFSGKTNERILNRQNPKNNRKSVKDQQLVWFGHSTTGKWVTKMIAFCYWNIAACLFILFIGFVFISAKNECDKNCPNKIV